MKEMELSNLSRADILEKAEGYFKLMDKLWDEGKFQELIINAEKAVFLYEHLEVWDKYVITQAITAKNYMVLSKPDKGFALIQDLLEFAIPKLGFYHYAIYEVYMSLGFYYGMNSDFDNAIDCFEQTLKISLHLFGENHHHTSESYGYLSFCYRDKGDFQLALDYTHKGLLVKKKIYEEYSEDISTVYKNLGVLYSEKKDFDKTLFYCNKSLKIRLKILGEKHPLVADCYHYMGTAYSAKSDHQLSIMYFEKALAIRQQAYGSLHRLCATPYSNIGNCYFVQGNFSKAIENLQKALDIQLAILKKEHPIIANTYEKIAKVYLNQHEYQKATDYYQKALDIQVGILGEHHQDSLELFINIGNAYRKMKQYELAIFYLEKALDISLSIFGNKHVRTASCYDSIGSYFSANENHEKALQYYQKSLYALCSDDGIKEITINPPIQDVQNLFVFLKVLQNKAKVLQQYSNTQSNSSIYLKAALSTYQLGSEAFVHIHRSYQTEHSKLNLSRIAQNLYKGGVQVALSLQSKSAAFYYAEKTKASLFLTTQQDHIAKIRSNIPDDLLLKDKELKVELAYLNKTIEKLKEQEKKKPLVGKDKEFLEISQSQFFDYHQQYTQLTKKLETDYPDYYQLKYDTKTITPTELQSTLEENQVVISYFVGEEKLYIFVVTSDDFEVIDLQLPTDFEALIQDFMDALTQHQYIDFVEKSHQLHSLLIAPIQDFIIDDFGLEEELKQVFVIPHGVLSYLPFEALIGGEKSFANSMQTSPFPPSKGEFFHSWSDLDYLLLHCEISYHYSATLLYRHLLKKQTEEELPNSFAGFAPIYDAVPSSNSAPLLTCNEQPKADDVLQQSAKAMQAWATRSEAIRSDGTWVNLPHSETEAKGIAQLFAEKGLEGKFFLREKASKVGFAEAAKRFKFLLVAAHGLVNDEKTALSGLVFYPSVSESRTLNNESQTLNNEHRTLNNQPLITNNRTDNVLSMEETHHLDLQADLVVLSSCESGIGTLHKGEGMMAVNRGFLAAGANNVVSTLFKVYDKPSSLLTQYLFEEILEGKPYSAALRLAKLKLMQQVNIDPKSWSGFVLIGGG